MSEERDLLAAEYALRLLEGAEHDEARRRAARDPEFAAAVAAWEEKFQPLAGALPEVTPDAASWPEIERRIAAVAPAAAAANDNHEVARRLRQWQLYGTGVTAVAASLAAVLGITLLRPPASAPVPAPSGAPAAAPQLLVASLAAENGPNAASITYSHRTESLLVAPVRWPDDPGHEHVLWVIPEGGEPVLIGACCQSGPQMHSIPRALVPHFRARSAIAVSVEPRGGPPGGRPSSPFVVRGELRPI